VARDARVTTSAGSAAQPESYRTDQLRRAEDNRRAALNLLEDAIRARAETERLHGETRESEQRFRALADSAPALIWVNGLEGCEYVNKGYLEFAGLEELGDVRGYDWSGYIHPEDREGYLDAYHRAVEARSPFDAEFRFRRRDGEYRWMRSVGQARYGPHEEFLGYAGLTLDITDRKQAEDLVRRTQETFFDLVKRAPFGIYVVDSAFRILEMNAGAVAQFASAGSLIGRDFAEVTRTIWLEPFAVEVIGHFRHTLETGESYVAPSVVQRRHDVDRVESYEWQIHRVELADGTHGVVCYSYDTTRLRQAEQRIAEQAENIAAESRRKDEFLAMLSHELRNPLAPICSAVHLLGLSERPGNEDGIQRKAREVIERQVGNLTKLINDLLEVSRVVSGRLRLSLQLADLNQLVEHAIETVTPIIQRRRHTLTVHGGGDPVWVQVDPTRIEEVFVNLLTNAAKYTKEGGRIQLWCEVSGGEGEAGFAHVRVRDNGAGIPATFVPRIFDLFAQADRSLDREQGGLGVGLTLAHRLVHLHGGTIEVKSPPDGESQGSEFMVGLPLMPTPESFEHPAVQERRQRQEGLRVLVVDDNIDQATMVMSSLRHLGYSVQSAHTGPEGLNVGRQWRPDVILLDIGLPGMDGYEVARRLRSDPAMSGVRVLAVTGYGREGDIAQAKEAGFDGHMTKPVDLDELERLMAAEVRVWPSGT